jgi:large subunit ribosomal protein L10
MRQEKKLIVADIASSVNDSPFVYILDYTGLTVGQFSELRNRLVAVGSRATVVKNSFLRKALAEVGLPDLSAVLKGQTAVVVGEKDAAAAAKVLKTFASETKKTEIRGGIVDRLSVTKAQVESIADLPAREVLLATLLGVLQAPASKLVRTLNEPGASLARVLQAKVDASAAA